MSERQQVLYLWTAEAAMESPVIAWSFHDGAEGRGPEAPAGSPPFAKASGALSDGWFLLQAPAASATPTTHDTGDFRYRFIFTRTVTIDAEGFAGS